mmetsp:Transcript_11698/g.23999  ORF Transcript_11698/g.23999 Transcript_11698/m.23999 type:complete len:684 (-) Transcript_11698:1342-3393(-)
MVTASHNPNIRQHPRIRHPAQLARRPTGIRLRHSNGSREAPPTQQTHIPSIPSMLYPNEYEMTAQEGLSLQMASSAPPPFAPGLQQGASWHQSSLVQRHQPHAPHPSGQFYQLPRTPGSMAPPQAVYHGASQARHHGHHPTKAWTAPGNSSPGFSRSFEDDFEDIPVPVQYQENSFEAKWGGATPQKSSHRARAFEGSFNSDTGVAASWDSRIHGLRDHDSQPQFSNMNAPVVMNAPAVVQSVGIARFQKPPQEVSLDGGYEHDTDLFNDIESGNDMLSPTRHHEFRSPVPPSGEDGTQQEKFLDQLGFRDSSYQSILPSQKIDVDSLRTRKPWEAFVPSKKNQATNRMEPDHFEQPVRPLLPDFEADESMLDPVRPSSPLPVPMADFTDNLDNCKRPQDSTKRMSVPGKGVSLFQKPPGVSQNRDIKKKSKDLLVHEKQKSQPRTYQTYRRADTSQTAPDGIKSQTIQADKSCAETFRPPEKNIDNHGDDQTASSPQMERDAEEYSGRKPKKPTTSTCDDECEVSHAFEHRPTYTKPDWLRVWNGRTPVNLRNEAMGSPLPGKLSQKAEENDSVPSTRSIGSTKGYFKEPLEPPVSEGTSLSPKTAELLDLFGHSTSVGGGKPEKVDEKTECRKKSSPKKRKKHSKLTSRKMANTAAEEDDGWESLSDTDLGDGAALWGEKL